MKFLIKEKKGNLNMYLQSRYVQDYITKSSFDGAMEILVLEHTFTFFTSISCIIREVG